MPDFQMTRNYCLYLYRKEMNNNTVFRNLNYEKLKCCVLTITLMSLAYHFSHEINGAMRDKRENKINKNFYQTFKKINHWDGRNPTR